MRPAAVAVDFDSDSAPRTSSDFEDIPYPNTYRTTNRQQEELPLHYMSEEKARRRVVKGPSTSGDYDNAPERERLEDVYDDESKGVYNKIRPVQSHIWSGRVRQAPPPPPTSIVRPRFRLARL